MPPKTVRWTGWTLRIAETHPASIQPLNDVSCLKSPYSSFKTSWRWVWCAQEYLYHRCRRQSRSFGSFPWPWAWSILDEKYLNILREIIGFSGIPNKIQQEVTPIVSGARWIPLFPSLTGPLFEHQPAQHPHLHKQPQRPQLNLSFSAPSSPRSPHLLHHQ